MHNGTQRARRSRRLPTFVALLVLIGAVCFVAAGAASGEGPNFTATPLEPDSTFSASKSPSGNLAQTDPALLGRTDASPVTVMIKYDFDATASYTGDLAGLAATSPAVTGVPLDENAGAVAAYDNYAEGQTALITSAVQAEVPEAQIGSDYQTVYGGVAATIPANTDRTSCSRSTASQRSSRTRSTSRRTTTRRSSARPPSGRRSAARPTRAAT